MISASALLMLLVYIIVAGLVFYLLYWLIAQVGLPEPFDKVARVILALVAVIFLIGVLMSFAGHPLIAWR